MAVPSNLKVLIEQIIQELRRIEENVIEGINLVRTPLSLFPENTLLVQFFAYLNNVFFLVQNYRVRIETVIELLTFSDLTDEEIQEIAEELSTMLGVVLESKIRVDRVIPRIRNLS